MLKQQDPEGPVALHLKALGLAMGHRYFESSG